MALSASAGAYRLLLQQCCNIGVPQPVQGLFQDPDVFHTVDKVPRAHALRMGTWRACPISQHTSLALFPMQLAPPLGSAATYGAYCNFDGERSCMQRD